MKRAEPVDALSVAGVWVVLSAVLVLASWGLSLAGALNAKGYAFVGALGVGGLAWLVVGGWLRLSWRPRWRRYRRAYPAVFLLSWMLAVLGGLLHAPNNIDTLTYRLPRILHWLAAGGWHWIDTVDPRMNYSGCGQEWLMAPVVSLTASDQWTWIWNALAQALLPGLLFMVLRGLGVAGAVAWRWMWLVPLAPIYLLQAGSVANDLLGAAYFLAALAWGFRACRRGSPPALALAVLAMALTTGIKSSNLPLVLPWFVLVWPALRQAGSLRRAVLVVTLPALLVSAVPTLGLNRLFTGDWTGDPANLTAVKAGSPWSALVCNSLQATLQNLQPPVFPLAEAVENRLAQGLEPAIRRWLGHDFPRFSVHLRELGQEEWAGLGGFLLLLLFGAYLGRSSARDEVPAGRRWGTAVLVAGGIAALAFFLVMGSEMTARLLAPYYPLAVAAVLRGAAQQSWVRSRWFSVLAGVAVLGSVTPLVISPARPLVSVPWLLRVSRPVQTVAAGVIERAETLYDVYAHRSDFLEELCAAIPTGARVVGFMATADDSEVSCWRPFGSRRVATVRLRDTTSGLEAKGIRWLVVRADVIWPATADQRTWLTGHSARVVKAVSVRSKAHRPRLEDWLLIQLDEPPPSIRQP